MSQCIYCFGMGCLYYKYIARERIETYPREVERERVNRTEAGQDT
jgi:hypothetical protein